MAPLNSSNYSQPQPSHPYSQASTSQSPHSTPPVDPSLAGLKVVAPSGSRAPSLLDSPQSYPPGPAADPKHLLAHVAKGLESLIDRGTIDARPSRQGVAAPRVGACSACREAKAKCSQGETCTRCIQNNVACAYPLFAKRGRKRTMTPCVLEPPQHPPQRHPDAVHPTLQIDSSLLSLQTAYQSDNLALAGIWCCSRLCTVT